MTEGVYQDGANKLTLGQHAFSLLESSWCCPATFASVPGLCYDRTVVAQPYDSCTLLQFGRAVRNWRLFFVIEILAVAASVVLALNPKFRSTAALVLGVVSVLNVLLLVMVHPAKILFWSKQRFWPMLMGAPSFKSSGGKVIGMAQDFLNRHAAHMGMTPPDLMATEDVTSISVGCCVRKSTRVSVSGDYVVVLESSAILPMILGQLGTSEEYCVFPKHNVVFVQGLRKNRNLRYFWLVFFPMFFVCLAADLLYGGRQFDQVLSSGSGSVSDNLLVYFGIAFALGVYAWWTSVKQDMRIGVVDDMVVSAKINRTDDLRTIALALLRGSFPPALQGGLVTGESPLLEVDGYRPFVVPPFKLHPVALFYFVVAIFASFLFLIILIINIPGLLCKLFCHSNNAPPGVQVATLRVFRHYIETHSREPTKCCCCTFSEGACYTCLANMRGLGEDYFLSVLTRTSLISAHVPGARMSFVYVIVGLVAAGAAYVLFQPDGLYLLIIFAVFAYIALLLFLERRGYVYIGDEERNSLADALGHETHHVQFAALTTNPSQLVDAILNARANSLAHVRQHGGRFGLGPLVPSAGFGRSQPPPVSGVAVPPPYPAAMHTVPAGPPHAPYPPGAGYPAPQMQPYHQPYGVQMNPVMMAHGGKQV